MGHESQIELWSPNLTTFCFVGFGTDRLRHQEAMKTAGKENPNRCAITRQPTELLERKLEPSLLNQSGWKARKHPPPGPAGFSTNLDGLLTIRPSLTMSAPVKLFLKTLLSFHLKEFFSFVFFCFLSSLHRRPRLARNLAVGFSPTQPSLRSKLRP